MESPQHSATQSLALRAQATTQGIRHQTNLRLIHESETLAGSATSGAPERTFRKMASLSLSLGLQAMLARHSHQL